MVKFCYDRPFDILDIACSKWEHFIRLVEKGYRLTGLDASKEMIEQAIRKAEGVQPQFLVQDMRRTE